MTDQSRDDGIDAAPKGTSRSVDESTLAALRALLHIPSGVAHEIRARTPARRRPRRQTGPSADYGETER